MSKHMACPFCGSTELEPTRYSSDFEDARICCRVCHAEGPPARRFVDVGARPSDKEKIAVAWRRWDERIVYCSSYIEREDTNNGHA